MGRNHFYLFFVRSCACLNLPVQKEEVEANTSFLREANALVKDMVFHLTPPNKAVTGFA